MSKPIPADVLFEILLHLPVKDIRRFESISKSCFSVIHDPLFIKRHLRQATETNSNSTLISLCSLRTSSGRKLPASDDISLICFADLDSPGKVRRFQVEKGSRVLSCNGLLCFTLSSDRYIAISNLITKPSDYHIVSIPPSVVSESEGYRRLSSPFYGFGFDYVNDDYKVLVMDVCIGDNHSYAETRVYSLRHNVWKPRERWNEVGQRERFPWIVDRFVSTADSSPNGVVASSAFHWLAVEYSNYGPKFILAFDFITEDFYEVALPDIIRSENVPMSSTRLGVLKGSLCVSSGDGWWQLYLDIWIMKDYNIHDSWTRIFKLQNNNRWDYLYSITPICSRSEDKVLILAELEQCFCWYDLRKREVIKVVLNPLIQCPYGFQPFHHSPTVCLETLVSVNDYKALWGKDSKRKRIRKIGSDFRVTKRMRTIEDDEQAKQALEFFYNLSDSFTLSQPKMLEVTV